MNFNYTLIGQLLAFILFVWFCMRFIWPQLLSVLEQREKEIADGLNAASEGKRELEEAGVKKEEILKMENIIGKIMEVENVNEYLSRLHPLGLSEASYKGYWLFKHKNGNKFKISGKTWIDYNENTFKSAFSVANK